MSRRTYWQRLRKILDRGPAKPPLWSCPLALEPLEGRALLSVIVWNNRGTCVQAGCPGGTIDSDRFFANYGGNAGPARAVVNAVLSTWENTIQDFNFRNVGQAGWAPIVNLYSVGISAGNITTCGGVAGNNFLGCGGPGSLDRDGKPFNGSLTLDDDGAGGGWNFGLNNGVYTDVINRFAASSGPAGFDLYSVALHEIGHTLGISIGGSLAINNRLSNPGLPAPFDPYRVFTFLDGTRAGYTDNGHSWDTTPPPGFPSHPNDLMNPATPPATRRLVSDLDARILRDGYGYTVSLPSARVTFLANYNSATRVLTVNGDPQVLHDTITLDVSGSNLVVNVGGVVSQWAVSALSRVVVEAGNGNDTVNIERLPGNLPVTVEAGLGNDTINLSPVARNLNNLARTSPVTIGGGFDNDSLNIYDDNFTGDRSCGVFNNQFNCGNFPNAYTVAFYNSTVENLLASAGSGSGTTFGVSSTAAGVSTFISGAANVHVNTQDVRGPVGVTNLSRRTALSISAAGDPTPRTDVQLNAGSLTGLTALTAPISWRPNELSALTITGGNGGNRFTVFNNPVNAAANLVTTLSSGAGSDTISVLATTAQANGGRLDVNAGADDDTIRLGSLGNTLASLAGTVRVDGEAGLDTLLLNDQGATAARAYTFDLLGINGVNVGYRGFENVTFNGGRFGNSLTVLSTSHFSSGPYALTLNAGAGNNTINVGNNPVIPIGLADIRGPLTVNGQGGTDTLNLNDPSATLATVYTISAATVTATRTGTNAQVNYAGIANVVLNGGRGDDTFDVTGTAHGTTTLNGGDGYDGFIVGYGGELSGIAGRLRLGGQAGGGSAQVNDSASGDARTYTWNGSSGSLNWDTVTVEAANLGFVQLVGGLGDDAYRVQGIGGIFAYILDAGGTNTLTGPDTPNTWGLVVGDYSMLGADVAFVDIQNLAGGSDEDVFVFADGAGVRGSINGGAGGNALDYSAYVADVYVNLLTTTATGAGAGASNIYNVIGGAGNDVLVGFGGNVLIGGLGRDLLIAGQLASTLSGGEGDDLLVGGITLFDTDAAALRDIRDGLLVLDATTAFSNGGGNTMTGGEGIDQFFGRMDLDVTDRDPETELFVEIG